MTYYADLTSYEYAAHDELLCGMPVLNVGWMEPPHPFPTGDVPPGFVERLFAFCAYDKLVNLACGHQDCGNCSRTYHELHEQFHIPLGNGEIRVLGKGIAYAAPSLIYHYVAAHSYVPPADFVSAVMDGPAPDSSDLRAFRFYYNEELIAETGRQQGFITSEPTQLRGLLLGARVRAYRRLAWSIVALAIAPTAAFFSLPLFVLLALGLVAYALAMRRRLSCPVCGELMSLPLQLPPESRLVRTRFSPVLFCSRCYLVLRPSLAPWKQAIADVDGV